ncbi:dual-domain HisK/Mak2 protein kinase [Pluteus cervinus]|uniref:Dual-domain HisK/Mak2 protein kinase n=1 Tax=Pluteus cervinus TaxID=181527 RepID=A0ACD3BGA8_9AGAR|nr:dual-domain HisK/Mak2 protein kinase [Pluteus cervinus]
MRRKFGQATFPTLYFRDSVLSIPGYTFEKAHPWQDTGSMTMLAEGNSLKDSSNVLAKIAPAQSNGSMCLEREAHILGKLASSAGTTTALRMIDFFKIPRDSGDCVVLLMVHPGTNLLGRYLPSSKINDLLLAECSRSKPPMSVDAHMMTVDEPDLLDDMEAFDIMDLASFLEFAIQATHCLEQLHKAGIIHREVRANAFHLNSHSGFVRLVHFGNRAISLESYGSPSSLVLRAYEENEKRKVKEALCYLAPEQTGSIETMTQDHRTDLYSLGILFWTLLVGRGQMPFEGVPLELLHAIVQKRPMPVHEVRRDVPQVLALILERLLAKHPDFRYQSAYGLKSDLMECQRRLLANVLATTGDQELISMFEIAKEDRFMEFTIPIALFGREKELETIRNVIRNVSTSFSRHFAASKGFIAVSSVGSQDSAMMSTDDLAESLSSRSDSSVLNDDASSRAASTAHLYDPGTLSSSNSMLSANGLRRVALRPKSRVSRTQAVIIVGSPGVGKSSMILANQAKWRAHGLWGQAKFQSSDSAPFAALLSCLSSVLRQLMVFHTDLQRFVSALTERLGPQIRNVPLLYQGTPELRDVLAIFGITLDSPQEPLATRELRARFQSLVENVFAVIADTRLFALFLDDLHDADQSTLDLVSTLLNSRSRMLIFATLRSDKSEAVERVKTMFIGRSHPTWISVEPLQSSAIWSLVSKTLHRSKEDCAPLSQWIFAASSGNPFSARNILMMLQRQRHITFDWERNHWKYDIVTIKESLDHQKISDPTDLTFLITHLRELPEEAKKYLIWAAFFGETFKVTEVALMMDWEDRDGVGTSGSDEEENMWDLHKVVTNLREKSSDISTSRDPIRGLQLALGEGWLIQRARDMCSFAHDRYRQAAQAEAESMPREALAKMSMRIILMMLHETPCDVYRVAEHAKRCLPLLHESPKREELLRVLIEAGEAAWSRGAHELAAQSFNSARSLLRDDPWVENPTRALNLLARIAALETWQGNYQDSDAILEECFAHIDRPEDQATLLRLRSQNHWLRNDFQKALGDNLYALKILGVDITAAPTRREADDMFEEVKNEILAVGFEEILSIPRATDPRAELAVALLNDAGTNAYWSPSPFAFVDIIGLTTIQLALRYGMTAGTAVGFFWALGAAAEHRELYRFSADLGKLALRIAERHGGSGEKCRAQVMYSAMVSGYDSTHVRSILPGLEEAVKYGNSSGDRAYTSFASIHALVLRLFVCEHLSELVVIAEECVNDVSLWVPGGDPIILAMGILNCIRVLGGYTYARSVDTVFDTDTFKEREYIDNVLATCGNIDLALNWYNAYKVVALYCVGFVEQAAEIGFSVYQTRLRHPNHRHIRYSLFFHSLSMVACLRKGNISSATKRKYINQIKANQSYVRRWLCPSPVNASAWVALVDAEMAALENNSDAYRLFDVAVKLAVNNDWLLEEGWALFLQGSHFVRCGVEGLGSELQRRGIARHAQWGAQGIVSYLTSIVGIQSHYPLKRPIFSSDVAVQTEPPQHGSHFHSQSRDSQDEHEDQESTLGASDLASILKWSKEISSDINLSSALQRLTEIATESSHSQHTCVVITRESGDYAVATSMTPPSLCQVYDKMKSIRTINDPLQKAIIQYTLNSKERLSYDDASADPRFATEAGQSLYRSVICIPIFGNRGQTFGAAYFSSAEPFTRNNLTKLTLLCQQASISISNALLFRSVQAGTRENLKMIATQQEALEEASRSREAALKATKIKSNFLASMSHELRTPFSSFYGLLDLLSGTELNPGQNEIVQTAKQSCELLLKIIDSILDYSKLEASAVKIEPSHFLVENIIADCMELLLPMAAKKLDLSFNIESDVPAWVFADYARIRQILMNLIGNAVKFTANGTVRVVCSLEKSTPSASLAANEVLLKFDIYDTGIGLSASDVDLLFVPFQQADNSSTRRFGGTGLGLSISRQLVKLMGGAIGVSSELNVGSTFWFTIPVTISDTEEAKTSTTDIEKLRAALMQSRPLNALVCSASKTTLALLNTMLEGFNVTLAESIEAARDEILKYGPTSAALDFFVLDDQSETRPDEFVAHLRSARLSAFQETKVIHLYTPTTSRNGQAIFSSNTPGVVKMTKPPRKLRLLHTLASLKNLPSTITAIPSSDITKATEDIAAAQRTLFGNVLIAEDNPIAQHLLLKQLERYNFNVIATSNGEEALAEWEAHEPGYFAVALFDHHMPICDGVEAAKRLRMLEGKRKVHVSLPIVALSADCQESTKQLCLSAGMNSFFSKPLKRGDLMSLLSMFGPPPLS